MASLPGQMVRSIKIKRAYLQCMAIFWLRSAGAQLSRNLHLSVRAVITCLKLFKCQFQVCKFTQLISSFSRSLKYFVLLGLTYFFKDGNYWRFNDYMVITESEVPQDSASTWFGCWTNKDSFNLHCVIIALTLFRISCYFLIIYISLW